jgi:HAMP domain-containing protein
MPTYVSEEAVISATAGDTLPARGGRPRRDARAWSRCRLRCAGETERQIDDLDHRVLAAAVFSLLGAALGYWMAERIRRSVNRLTRATRRIARGNLDARRGVASDELGRLIRDFNRMAEDLKRQRGGSNARSGSKRGPTGAPGGPT